MHSRDRSSPASYFASALFCCKRAAAQEPWLAADPAELSIPRRGPGPMLACTQLELQRLVDAWKGEQARGAPVRDLVQSARQRMTQALVFPLRGGQHNQWYQCDRCQLGLKTVDDTHHRSPKCEQVYSGAPYDDVIFSRIHRANAIAAKKAAWAWRVTGERAFADWSARVLLGYAQRYSEYPYHTSRPGSKSPGVKGGHILEQTPSEASLLVVMLAPAMDLIWDTLDEEQRAALRYGSWFTFTYPSPSQGA